MQQPDVYIMMAIPCLVNKTFKFITNKAETSFEYQIHASSQAKSL